MLSAGPTSYTWDDNGNLLSQVGPSGTVTYTYDYANRLKTATGAALSTYAYNGDGLRVSQTVDGVATSYLWDSAASLPVIISDTDSLYLYGLSLIAMQEGGSTSYYHQDGLGTIRGLTDEQGQPIIGYDYDPFGVATRTAGTSANPFRYTGQYFDNSTGLYYLRARYYDPALGKFLSPDPILPDYANPQSINRYVYSRNSPVNKTDPTGLDPLDAKWHFQFLMDNGRLPNDQDRRDRLFSVIFPGSGPKGEWTRNDWLEYYADKDAYWRGRRDWKGNTPSGLDSFRRHLGRLATNYECWERNEFVRDVGFIWGGIPPVNPIAGALQMALDPRTAWAAYPPLHEGNANWNPELVDPGETNQSHHYAGLFYTGYFFGAPAGMLSNWLRDGSLSGRNEADITVGNLAARHGQMLAEGRMSISQLSLAVGYSLDARPGIWPSDTPRTTWPW